MTEKGASRPPFRADHVGSLLRPAELRAARAGFKRGAVPAERVREIEDRCIGEIVNRQERVGLEAVTDGEFRRDWWHLDFLSGFDGIELTENTFGGTFNTGGGQPPQTRVTSRVGRGRPIMIDHFAYLKSATARTAKFCIPAPAMAHLRGGRGSISADVYPDLAAFWADLCDGYRAEIADLAAAGCTYLQIDDVSYAYLCDEKLRGMMRERGDEPDELAVTYAEAVNRAVADRPDGMTVALHVCRGNFQSAWMAEGGYDSIAETVFGTLAVDALFLEYDSARAGGFEPLRFIPENKTVVLGLITTKTPALERKDDIKRRIDEAARYVPLERLCLSPQCGFSSTHHGNRVTEDDQWRKLALVVEIAREVWGET